MSQAQIDVSGMRTAAGNVNDVAGHVKAEGNGVQASVSQLMTTWTGTSARTFDGAMGDFYGECNSIVQTLEALSSIIKGSADAYQQTHDSATGEATAFLSHMSLPKAPPLLPNF
ncbi:WXG100 family type VII secretion target [Kineosporia sp. NBRC 101731]|uniref:WXG100 family type VII secretion target n=1 Tax=Kineosporia sp. NBRC 101731 TaxID=3032199 RepID=UPI0024A29B7B|nr:WXG100 family type VII secretion target [Kineosporia sp. NBRC 101731]GLY31521.1 hypothetical protein Kisp02_48860 [Kineosporia sp. NBRC 101731]